ncbi:uncharacterized protein BJ212DRAFT_1475763 [Suillus subaureus]|uniref:Uncharacterized protein n=1 Tax=Suillus subaureus TaxID=48587 RepID=A0A9P7EL10_9AGAM|nr:uncharacterized protein BJ212DRAFT_1475763 [Suillus subaureus]KAG1824462.1 hypothetical protein BJ212DRAFT_1475763 [Suillus subaureus]
MPDNNIIPHTFNQFDISNLDITHLDDLLTSLLQAPYDPFTAIGPIYGLEDLNFSFMDNSSDSFNYQYSPSITHEPTDHLLPAFSGDMAMPGNIPLSHAGCLPPATPLTSTSSVNMTDSNTIDCLTGVEEEGPCQTTHCHVPSTCEHVLNAISSSSACVNPPTISIDKENNKQWKAGATGTGQQSRKKQKHT